MPRQLIVTLLMTWLSGCAWLTMPERNQNYETLPLAAPINPPRRIVQQITAQWPEHQDTFICVLELNNRRIAVAGITKDGMSLFNINYDGNKLDMDKSPLLPNFVKPDHIIRDLQWVFWPFAELHGNLPKHWRLTADQNQRQLYVDDELRLSIDYIQPDEIWAKTVVLTNHYYHYRLHIKTLSYEALSQ